VFFGRVISRSEKYIDVKNQMKNEKKMITLSILALVIGVATVLPMTHFLHITDATVQAKPLLNPNVYTIAVHPDSTTLLIETGDTAVINIDATYAFHNIANFKDTDAKIEVYNYHISSDQASIANITHTIAITKDVPDSNSPSGFISAIRDRSREKNTYTFADGTIFDITEAIGYVESSRLSGIIYDQGPTDDLYSVKETILLSGSKGERSAQAVYNARNAQKIYVDVTMILSVTYKHPNTPGASAIITTTSTNSDVLFHAELTKLNDGSFRYITEKTNTPDNIPFNTPDTNNLPPNTSNLPPNIIKLPPDTIIAEPAITLLLKVFTTNPVIQKQTT
jgi:hypothetical protein